jgi:hypothetical protein
MTMTDTDPRLREFDLLERASTSAEVTVRDDQVEFSWLLDAVHTCRKHGGRFRLVDSGTSDPVSLSWLAEAGADIYTSDEARPAPRDVIPVRLSARKSGAHTFYYIGADTAENSGPAPFLADFAELGLTGVDLHLSNREKLREPALLVDLSRSCSSGRGRLVYYHYGRLAEFLEDVALAGGWTHWTSGDVSPDKDAFLLKDILRACRKTGAGLILHAHPGWPPSLLSEAFEAGAFLLFHGQASERASSLRRLENEAARRRPDVRAFYLHRDFLP